MSDHTDYSPSHKTTLVKNPEEFLHFANEILRNKNQTTTQNNPDHNLKENISWTNIPRQQFLEIPVTTATNSFPNGSTTISSGLCVLNNLCRLIEQIQTLRTENEHLRSRIEIIDNIHKFQRMSEQLNLETENILSTKRKITLRASLKEENTIDGVGGSRKKLKFIRDKLRSNDDNILSEITNQSNNNNNNNNMLKAPTVRVGSIKRQNTNQNNDHHHSTSSRITSSSDEQNIVVDPITVKTTSNLYIDEVTDESGSVHSTFRVKPQWNNWNKVRHVFRVYTETLRRKRSITEIASSPTTNKIMNSNMYGSIKKENLIVPRIVCSSFESDDENNPRNHDINDNIHVLHREEDVEKKFTREKMMSTDTANSSSTDRQDSVETRYDTQEDLTRSLDRKQSKIARYGRKIKSKLDNVKKQFEISGGQRRNFTSFEENNTLHNQELKITLAPALTKEYRKKMQEWEAMQKMNFLVNYRRQSTGKIDAKPNSRKQSSEKTTEGINNIIRQTSSHHTLSHLIVNTPDVEMNYINGENDFTNHVDGGNDALFDKPLLSPNQRTQMVHQWRTIMNEEITLRHYLECIENKMTCLKLLERELKSLKTTIFCTNNESDEDEKSPTTGTNNTHRIKLNSFEQLNRLNTCQDKDKIQRSRSLETLETVSTLWVLAVRSAAYSDILDGTSGTRPLIRNMDFFRQLDKIQAGRKLFGESLINDIQAIREKRLIGVNTISDHAKAESQIPKLFVQNQNHKRLNDEFTSNKRNEYRAQLKKHLSDPKEFPNYWEVKDNVRILTSSLSPNQTEIEHIESLIDENNHQVPINENEKRRKRFEWRKKFQRSKSICVNHIQLWLKRRKSASEKPDDELSVTERNYQTLSPKIERRKASAETELKSPKLSSLSPKERFNRLHKLIFKQRHRSPPPAVTTPSFSSSTESNEMTNDLSPVLTNRHAKNSLTTSAQVLVVDAKDNCVKLYVPTGKSDTFENHRKTLKNDERKISEAYDNTNDIEQTIRTENIPSTTRNVTRIAGVKVIEHKKSDHPTLLQQQQVQKPTVYVTSSRSKLTNNNNVINDDLSLSSASKTPSSAEQRRASFHASYFAIKKI